MVVIQSDLLEAMRTRVVVPLLAAGTAGRPVHGLNPEIDIAGQTFVLMPQLLATLTIPELGQPVGSVTGMRDPITRSVDALMSGV